MDARQVDTLVIGGGQAGLATGYELSRRDIEPVILERDRVASTWRGLWDGFYINTPNWSLSLPGHVYDGGDPDGFLTRRGIVDYMQDYADQARGTVLEGVGVSALKPVGDGFALTTDHGPMVARSVVVCTGAFQKAFQPPGANELPDGLLRISTRDYRSPDALPDGAVLVVGSGQSGCQIAEHVVDAAREVILAWGRAAWAPHRIDGHDLFWWMLESGFMDQRVETLKTPAERLAANLTASGVGGGHDLHVRSLQAKGVTLTGRFAGREGRWIRFKDDLAASVAWGDDRYRDLRGAFQAMSRERGLHDPDLPDPEPFAADAPDAVPIDALGAVIFARGFRSDYADWIDVPGGFDAMGFPVQHDGASTAESGLFFAGVHFLRTRKSSLICGVGNDAAVVANAVKAHLDRGRG